MSECATCKGSRGVITTEWNGVKRSARCPDCRTCKTCKGVGWINRCESFNFGCEHCPPCPDCRPAP